MRILIIGGNRFFGKRLAENLLAEGHELTLLNRGNLEDKLGPAVKRLEADRRVESELLRAVEPGTWDIVYDQVCFNAAEAGSAVRIFSGRTEKYIFTSSQSVYGPGADLKEKDFDPYSYSFDPASDFDYAEGKRRAEAIFFAQESLPVIAARFPIVVGPEDHTGRLRFHLERILEGLPLFFPAPFARLSLLSSEDAARALAYLGTAKITGPINVAASLPMKLSAFVAMLESKLGRRAELVATGGEQEHSPYGVSEDWFMNTEKLNAFFRAKEIVDWLPALVEEIRDSLVSESPET